jgi:uncharacterized cupredoxin-like copper-binding protein
MFVGLGVIAAVSWSGLLAGCGGDDDTSSTAAATESTEATESEGTEESDEATEDEGSAVTTPPAGGGETVKIEMGEFYFKPDNVQAGTGVLTIDAPNVGDEPHELVVAKTDDDPAKLPTGSDGSVEEDSLDVVGEVEEVDGGADGSVTLDLEPGDYAMFCNLPGHYAAGMYGSLTVK